jgi:hypothetical protein
LQFARLPIKQWRFRRTANATSEGSAKKLCSQRESTLTPP